MGLFPALEKRSGDKSPTGDFWYQIVDYLKTSSGVVVSETSALYSTPVYSCISLISRHMGSMPLQVFERKGDGSKRLAVDHPNYPLLHARPNPEMTAMSLRSTLMAHMLGWGTYYANKEWTAGYTRVKALWPLRPDRIVVERDPSTGELIYVYTLPGGEPRKLSPMDVLRVNGLGYNGIQGYSPIEKGKEAIGLARAMEKHGALFFANGAIPGLALTHPGTLSETAHENLRKSWEKAHQGLDNKHRLAILEEGVTIKEIGINPELSQFLETRRFQIEEIARMFNIPLHKISDLSRATFNNIEHLSQEYLTDCLLPYAVQNEQSYNWDLFTEKDRGRYFTEHNFEGLLRGDSKARAEYYRTMFNIGAFSPNMILSKENMNPIGDEGDFHMVQVNMVPLKMYLEGNNGQEVPEIPVVGTVGGDEGKSVPARSARERRTAAIWEGRKKLRDRHRGLIRETVAQLVTREVNTVRRYVESHLKKGDVEGFETRVDGFYTDVFPDYARMKMNPVFGVYADALAEAARGEVGVERGDDTGEFAKFVSGCTDHYVAQHVRSSRGQIRVLLHGGKNDASELFDGNVGVEAPPEDAVEAVESRMAEWEETRADKDADNETVGVDGAVAHMVFASHGFNLRWAAVGESCPYCSMLDNMVVGGEDFFLKQDEDLQPPNQPPMRVRFSKRHPPAHAGCDCMIVAG